MNWILKKKLQVISAFLVLAVYLTSQSFQEWNDEPVLTTLKNTALPIDKVSHVIIKFPNQNSCKLTFCKRCLFLL